MHVREAHKSEHIVTTKICRQGSWKEILEKYQKE